MSIYVLRSDNLVKIGFSEHLRTRVNAIIAATPVPVEFVGHMPGGRDLEAHLHERFAAHRFSGEWFVETPAMRDAFESILTPRLPAGEQALPAKKRTVDPEASRILAARIRNAAAQCWPDRGKVERVDALAERLGWNRSRVFGLYYSDTRVALRAFEQEELDSWLEAIA